jgi:hypothetical protein
MTIIDKMTLEELQQLIDDRIDRRFAQLFSLFDDDDLSDDEPDTRTWEEVKQDIEKHRWTPPPGTPSVNELLRHDRDS